MNRKSLLHQNGLHFWLCEAVSVILLLAPSIVCAQESGLTPTGFVAQVRGTWTRVRDEKQLSTGDAIFPNTTVQTKQITGSAIRIAMFDGTVWTRRCAVEQPCDGGSYAVPTPREQEHGFLNFLSSYFAAQRKVPIIFAASRSINFKGPEDGLIEIDNQTISLSQVLERIPNGVLRLRLSKPMSPAESGLSEELQWPRQTAMRIGTRPPGLYALDVQDANNHPIGSSVALLLVDAKTFPHAASEFKAAKELAGKWEGIDGASIRSFLVSSLYAIETEAHE